MDGSSAQRWQLVAAVAATQWGRITVHQLREAGIGRGAIEKAVACGRLHREHVGVYVVGHLAPSDLGRWNGAVLACGARSALSLRSAASLFRIRSGEGPAVDVTVPTRNGRRRPGIAIHRAPLPERDVVVREGIRVTTVARTLADLAYVLDADGLHRAVREAQYLKLFDLAATRAAARRRPSRALDDLIEDMTVSSSALDDAFTRLLDRHRFPQPTAQKRLLGHRVDYVWEAQRVAVELDGWSAHVAYDAFQRDRAQANALQLAGWLVLRFTWADVHRRSRATVATIRRALGRTIHPSDV
jgi:very-short-patch-repair endonuclease